MYRDPFDIFRLFFSLFQDLPPLPRTIYIPGAVLVTSYPVLAVMLGGDGNGHAMVTAFLIALSVRIALGFEGMVRRMLMQYSVSRTVVLALVFSIAPLAVLALASDPLWCQRMQSAFYVIIGGVFFADYLRGRSTTAATFWPAPEMQGHLMGLTRMMVVYNFAFLVLNETMIRSVDVSHWLLFWAVLPVIGHTVLRALVLTVINADDDQGHPV
ncbi:MAG: hypothetical protein HC844_09410 [Tabrizicola sp.]|nr:hypothetical protein [Tabrizicola sp.]